MPERTDGEGREEARDLPRLRARKRPAKARGVNAAVAKVPARSVRARAEVAKPSRHREVAPDSVRADEPQSTHADRRLRAAVDVLREQLYVVDVSDGRFIDVNQTAERHAGFARSGLLERGPSHLTERTPEQVQQFLREIINAGAEGVHSEAMGRNRDGERVPIESEHAAFVFEGRDYVVTTVRNVEARKRQDLLNRRLRNMYAALSNTNEAILHARSVPDLLQHVCMAATSGGYIGAAVFVPEGDSGRARLAATSGHSTSVLQQLDVVLADGHAGSDGIIARAFRSKLAVYVDDPEAAAALSPQALQIAQRIGVRSVAALPICQGEQCIGVLVIGSVETHVFDAEIKSLLSRMTENIAFGLANIEALEERRLAEERARHHASHDALTGLPNRALFSELLAQSLQLAKRELTRLAVMFVDLDRFKVVNDSLGHEAGDRLLQTMARRLRATLRASDVVARLGGDEFVVLLPNVRQRAEVATVARKLLAAILEPVDLEGVECRVSASIGVCVYPDVASDESTLMSNADAAMYRAKQNGRNNVQFYSRTSRQVSTHQLMLESQLRGALARDEFALVYQPKQELATGVITGVEALLRWHNAHLGNVTPAEFIPLAEETGVIEDIGRWVLRTACEQNVAWQQAGLSPVSVAVNLSPTQFLSRTLVRDIDDVLRQTGMAASLLELEITESMVVQNPLRAREILGALKSRGIRIAIDDFGTGYSSLGQLRNFPIDALKVDRSFVSELANDAEDRAITQAIIAMGRTLSLTVVAEGVETPEQAAFLRANACDEVQGFYFGRPMPPAQLAQRLRDAPKRS